MKPIDLLSIVTMCNLIYSSVITSVFQSRALQMFSSCLQVFIIYLNFMIYLLSELFIIFLYSQWDFA